MTTSESVHAYDVVIVPFPYAERLAEKRRRYDERGIACIEPNRVVRRAGTLDARNASAVAARLGEFLAKRRAPTR